MDTRRFQVVDQLHLVDRCQALDGFDFHDQSTGDKEIGTKLAYRLVSKVYPYRRLLDRSDASITKPDRERVLVHVFEKTMAEFIVNIEKNANDRFSKT